MTESKTFQYIKSPIDSSLVLICDHASNYLPDKMNSLGLSKETLYSHIAWDPGSAYLTKIISKSLNTHAILASYSRLLVDLNRNENHKDLIIKTSDGIKIPANYKIKKNERLIRIKNFHKPYHSFIKSLLTNIETKGKKPSIICIHTFTESLKDGNKRPWHIGVLHRKDMRLADPIITKLSSFDNIRVGLNKPYDGFSNVNYTMCSHGEEANRPFVTIEVRQDLLSSKTSKKMQKNLINILIKTVEYAFNNLII